MYGVVGGDAVAGDHQQARVSLGWVLGRAEAVHLADLPAGDEGQVDDSGHVARCYQRRRGPPACDSGDLVQPRDDVAGVANVVGVVEDLLEIELAPALVLGEQIAQRDAVVPDALSQLLDEAVGLIA